MKKDYDLIIIGAGPAGLAAAITAKTEAPEASVLILEKMEKAGKKLSASGNGRGNIANLKGENLDEALRFFAAAGIAVRTGGEGRIYPYSEDASSVTETLVREALSRGARLLTAAAVEKVEVLHEGGGGFVLSISAAAGEKCVDEGSKTRAGGEGRKFCARRLIVATGGKSYAVYGSTGDGYAWARALGHTVTPPVPGLTAIECAEPLEQLAGLRVKGEVSLFKEGELIFRERGEIQFRQDGISGICVMNLSSALPAGAPRSEPDGGAPDAAGGRVEAASKFGAAGPAGLGATGTAGGRFAGYAIRINYVPDLTVPALLGLLRERNGMPETLLKKPLAREIMKRALGRTERNEAERLSDAQILSLANQLRGFTLTPCGRKGWKEAQVTRGGVVLDELDPQTMESKLIPGLYFAGEVTDYDGPCGGFNLNHAWVSGSRAGRAAVTARRG